MTGSWARIATILLGVWLFLSTFAWRHTEALFTNTWLTGMAAVAFGLLSIAIPKMRYFSMVLAIWLFVSTFALPTGGVTIWNNAIVALLIFAFSLVPGHGRHAGPFGHHRRVTA